MKLITLSCVLSLLTLVASQATGDVFCTGGVQGTGECEKDGQHTFCCSNKKSGIYATPRRCPGSTGTPAGAPACPGGGSRNCCV
ncbi:hypothetical protein VTL71DRAFT_16378 [Oculimacula yallundae]|uniref:Uncharacterized protein n=1 Tax=Oculimacula yallundae TaxID=86028 RepID=A0ABR4CEA7_9HELO